MTETKNQQVDRLLHDAEHAHGGAQMADMMRDATSARELREKRDRLLAEALALDPCPQGDPECETGDDGSCHDACEAPAA